VPVHIFDVGSWTEPEAIVFGQVTVTDADFFALGTYATAEPPSLAGYVFTELAGATDAEAATAYARAGVLLGEVMQQLRDDPSIDGALATTLLRRPPRVASETWLPWLADADGASIVRLRVNFTVAWIART